MADPHEMQGPALKVQNSHIQREVYIQSSHQGAKGRGGQQTDSSMSQNDGDAGKKKKREKANGARVVSPETGESPALTGIFLIVQAILGFSLTPFQPLIPKVSC